MLQASKSHCLLIDFVSILANKLIYPLRGSDGGTIIYLMLHETLKDECVCVSVCFPRAGHSVVNFEWQTGEGGYA